MMTELEKAALHMGIAIGCTMSAVIFLIASMIWL